MPKTPTPTDPTPADQAAPEETSPEELAARIAARRADDRTIYERMLDVAQDVGPIGKDARNVDSGYAARGIDDVLTKIHYALVAHGVVLIPEIAEGYPKRRDGIPTRSGGTQAEAILRIRYTFRGAVLGDELSIEWEGEALDSADKAMNKAASACLKYAFLQTFTIPLYGPETDADTFTPERGAERAPDFDQASKEILGKIVATVKELREAGVEVDAQGWKVLGVDLVLNRRTAVDEIAAEGILARLELLRPAPPAAVGAPEVDHAAQGEEDQEHERAASVDGFLGADLPGEAPEGAPAEPGPTTTGNGGDEAETATEDRLRCQRCNRPIGHDNALKNIGGGQGQPVVVGCEGCQDEPAMEPQPEGELSEAELAAEAAEIAKPDKG